MSKELTRVDEVRVASADEAILQDAELWDVVSSGDLKGLSPKQRSDYYLYRCRQEGLNPASQPFTYLVLNGKGILYGNKTAADQLRKVHGISIVDLKFSDDGEYLTYEITVQDRDGRRDVDVGQVFVGAAKGEQRANARMKAITKAKRRATYSICGSGVLDETEVESIAGARGIDPQDEASVQRVRGHVMQAVAADAAQGNVVTAADPDALEVIDADTSEIADEESGPITRDQSRRLVALKSGLNWTIQRMRSFSNDLVGKQNSNDLTESEAAYVIEMLEREQDLLLDPDGQLALA